MKRTFYLFSSGRLERKDNTLKFTPIRDGEDGEEEIDEELKKSGELTDEERENRTKAIITSVVSEVNGKFAAYKAVKKIIIRKSDFIKTTTHKIKRLEEKNKEEE